MNDLSTVQIYEPIRNSRRSEKLAWVFALSLFFFLVVSPVLGFFRTGGVILFAFFLLSAMILSVGNWINRRSKLLIDGAEICLINGVADKSLKWVDIDRLEVYQGRFNDKIVLLSASGRIGIDIVCPDGDDSESSQRFGFEEGGKILNLILIMVNLNKEKQQAQGYYYYSKE